MNLSTVRLRAFAPLLLALCATGCAVSGYHSPAVDVLGSYFPAWMVCIISGLALTLIARALLISAKVDMHLHPAAVVYPCLTVIFTMATWLAFFRN